jgi:hypothetical protein
MASQYDKYRFRDERLDDETFNKRWRDIDARLDAVEKLGFNFATNEDALVATALRRINQELIPVIEQIQAFTNLSDLLRAPSASEVTIISSGHVIFELDANHRRSFAAPLFVIASVAGSADTWMAGQVESWDATTGRLVLSITRARGIGTYAAWVLSVCSIPPDLPPSQSAANIALDPIEGLSASEVQEGIRQMVAITGALSNEMDAALEAKAPLNSPAFIGIPTAPAPQPGSATAQIATTSFVTQAIAGLMNSAPGQLDTLKELADALGNDANFATTVTQALAGKAPLDSPTLTGNPTAPTQASGNNSTRLATTAFVQSALAAKANLDSPVLTGTPAAPTAAGGTNNTQIATTAFVQSAIANRISAVVVTPARPTSASVIYGITPSISGSTLTLTLSWREAGYPSTVGESSTGG